MHSQILLSDAAKLVQKAPATLRRLVNDGRIPSTKDAQGRNRVFREEVIAYYANMDGPRAINGRSSPVQEDRVIKALSDQIAILAQTVDREREENKELRQQVRNLEGELLKITSEMKAFLTEKSGGTGLMRWIQSKRGS